MHSINKTKTIIGTQKSVYWDSSAGKLEETSLVRSMFSPHQQRFYCDSKACFSIAIHHLPTPAFEQCVGVAMPSFSHSTAVATPFAGVMGVNSGECDVFVEAPTFKVLSELIKGHTHDFPVEVPAFWIEPFEFLYSNVGVVLQSQFGDVSDNFTNPVFDEVLFSGFEFEKFTICLMASFIGITLDHLSLGENLLAFNPDVLAEIQLLQDSTFWTQDADSEALTVHINTNNILALLESNILFIEEGNNLSVGSQSICLAGPTILNQRNISLVVPILADGNGNWLSGIGSKLHEQKLFGFKNFAVSRHIELNGDVFEDISFRLHNTAFNIADYLTVEGGDFLAG